MTPSIEDPQVLGRDVLLDRLAGWLDIEPPHVRVVFVHGPAGVGKSTTLQALHRHATSAGMAVRRVDGRDAEHAPEATHEALEALRADGGLLLLDTYEQVPVLGAMVRAALLDTRASLRVLVAGRAPPEAAWRSDEVRGVLLELELEPLGEADARALVRARGVDSARAGNAVTALAGGLPLTLTVAADALAANPGLDLAETRTGGPLSLAASGTVAGAELLGADREVLAVAAMARAVDARLLGAVLPATNGDQAETWLRRLPFAEALGTRVTLHESVRSALRTTLAESDPEHARELRRRIADHLYARAALGELRLMVDLVELIEDPAIRWAVAPSPAVDFHAACTRPGDAEVVADLLGAAERPWWPATRRWFDEAPDRVTLVRDAAGRIAGYGITCTPATAPAWVHEDVVVAPMLADALRRAPDGNALLFREGDDLRPFDAAAGPSPVNAVGNYAIFLRSELRSVRVVYAMFDPARPAWDSQEGFLRAFGYEPVPALDAEEHGRELRCFVIDHGTGGVMRGVRDTVYRSMGLEPPPILAPTALAADAVRDALRSFHDPVALAASPLAIGPTPDDRAAMVRHLLRSACAAAFGDSVEERLQRATVERGYLDPAGGHHVAASELHLGRTTYFRRLGEASARVSAYVLARLA